MLSKLALFTLTLVSFTAAQNLEAEAIKAHFKQAQIVPQALPDFAPTALLSLKFTGIADTLTPGQKLTKEQSGPEPVLNITKFGTAELDGKYTLAMIDVGTVGSDQSKGAVRHWLVNGVTISGSSVQKDGAVSITNYAGPGPAAGSGSHRYVILLYSQPDAFKAPDALSTPGLGVEVFDFNAYVKDSGLGALVAGNYFQVEVGTASETVSATSPVNSATLLGGSSPSGSSRTHSGTPSPSSAQTTTPAPSRTPGSAVPLSVSGSSLGLILVGLINLL